MKKNSIIQSFYGIIILLLGAFSERKQHVPFSVFSKQTVCHTAVCFSILLQHLFFKFSFEFLQRFFNVFAFFYWYYNHVFKIKYVVIKLFRSQFAAQNYTYFFIYKTFRKILFKKSTFRTKSSLPFLYHLLIFVMLV